MDSKDWEPDSASATCRLCDRRWGVFSYRRHHCRNCGKLVCFKCSGERMYLKITCKTPVRVCDKCVKSIRSTERPKLDQEENLDEEEDDDDVEDKGSDCISVVSDGKCKATERPFRNIFSDKNRPEVSRPEETPVVEDDFEEEEECKESSLHEDSNQNPEILQLEEDAIMSTSNGNDIVQAKGTFDSLCTDATGGSGASEGTPLSLHQLHEASSAQNLLKKSIEEKGSNHVLSLSKFGNMAFSDEESAGTTPFSTRDSAAIVETSNAEVSSVAATTGSPENVPADTASTASGHLQDVSAEEASGTLESTSHKTDSNNEGEGDKNSSQSGGKPRPLHLTPKQGPLRMARRKSTSPATLPADLTLDAGKSPMPTGGTVRRLSTYASAAAPVVEAAESADIATRTPFNSTVTPSADAAAAVAQAQSAIQEESMTVPIATTAAENTVEASSGQEGEEEGEGEDTAAMDEDCNNATAEVVQTADDNKNQGRKTGKNRRKGKGKK